MSGFDSLFLLTRTISSSIPALVWTLIFLAAIHSLSAILLHYRMELYYMDDSKDLSSREKIYRLFGTFSRSLFTTFELTLGNYVPVSRVMIEHVSEWYTIFCIVHRCAIGFAMLSVMRGVFMHETFAIAARDDRIIIAQKERSAQAHTTKMKKLFQALNLNDDEKITSEEFRVVCESNTLRMWLGGMELNIDDADLVYSLIAGSEDEITLDQLVKGMSRLKGNAKNISLATLEKESQEIHGLIQQIRCALGRGQDISSSTLEERTHEIRDLVLQIHCALNGRMASSQPEHRHDSRSVYSGEHRHDPRNAYPWTFGLNGSRGPGGSFEEV